MGRKNTVFTLLSLQNDGPGSIPEEHTGVTVLPVDGTGEDFSADDQGFFYPSGFNLRHGSIKRKDKAAAGCRDIKGDCVFGTELILDQAGGRRPGQVTGDGSDDNVVDIFCSHTSHVHGIACSIDGQIRGIFVLGSNPSFADAGPGPNPLIGGIDQFFNIFIGEDFFRQVGTGSDNTSFHFDCSPSSAVGRWDATSGWQLTTREMNLAGL